MSFFSSAVQLSHTTCIHLYSKRGLMKLRYIFSRQKRESMNLRERSIPNRCHALLSMEKIWSFHLASSVKVRPICLWERTDSIGTLFISKGGWIGLSRFRWKDHWLCFQWVECDKPRRRPNAIFWRSKFITAADASGVSITMYRLVSSANTRMLASISVTMSFI